MGIGRRVVGLPWLFWFLCSNVWAGEPGRFAVSQAAMRPSIVTVYLDILDANGQPPTRLVPSQLSAALQGHPLKVTDLAPFDSAGEGVAYFFLVDISRSIKRSQFEEMRGAINAWIDDLRGNDRMAIFTFGEDYKQLVDFTTDKQTLKSALKTAGPTDSETKLHLALRNAMDLSKRSDEKLPNRRVVVVLSDGKDEGSGLTVDDVRGLTQQGHLPIYAIGYSRLPIQEREKYLDVLHRFANFTGGLFRDSSTAPLAATYGDVRRAIRRVFVAKLSCEGCQQDSQSHPLDVTLTIGTAIRNDRFDVNLIPPTPKSASQSSQPRVPTWAYAVFGLLAVGILVTVVSRTLRKKPVPPAEPPPLQPAQPAQPVQSVQPAQPVQPMQLEQPVPVRPAGGLPIRLTTVAGKERGRVYELNLVEKSTIGRDAECDVTLQGDDPEVSSRHCELGLVGTRVELQDLGSTNGTLLNGARVVARQALESGDLIRVGRTELRITIGEPS